MAQPPYISLAASISDQRPFMNDIMQIQTFSDLPPAPSTGVIKCLDLPPLCMTLLMNGPLTAICAYSFLQTNDQIGNWNIPYYRFNKFATGTSNCYRSRRLPTGTSTWLLKEALRAMSPSGPLLFSEQPDVCNQ